MINLMYKIYWIHQHRSNLTRKCFAPTKDLHKIDIYINISDRKRIKWKADLCLGSTFQVIFKKILICN